MKLGAALDFGFTAVVDFAEVDTFTGVAPFAPFKAFPFVSGHTTVVFFASFPDFTDVLVFTGGFAFGSRVGLDRSA